MQSDATTVAEYIATLPDDRRKAIAKVRATVNKHIPKGYKEVMQYGMISWVIPLTRYPNTYNKHPLAIASLANQKNYMSLYLLGIYAEDGAEDWFHEAYRATGKRLDIGKSCVRFRTLEDLPLDVIDEAISRTTPDDFIALYEASRTKK